MRRVRERGGGQVTQRLRIASSEPRNPVTGCECQARETPRLPSTSDVRFDLPTLRPERLAWLPTVAAMAIDHAGRPLPCSVKVKRVPHGRSPDAQRP